MCKHNVNRDGCSWTVADELDHSDDMARVARAIGLSNAEMHDMWLQFSQITHGVVRLEEERMRLAEPVRTQRCECTRSNV